MLVVDKTVVPSCARCYT